MKAFILAAGLGTRLRPWTLEHPKALVPVQGVPMLERVIRRLAAEGFDDITVNVHHFASQIEEFLARRDFGVNINVSDERSALLDTGGALLHAAPIICRDREPILVHNVDILSDAPLAAVMENVSPGGASLLTSGRSSSRRLCFDTGGKLQAWHNLETDQWRPDKPKDISGLSQQAFSGIHAISPAMIEAMPRLGQHGAFSIIDFYLAAANAGMEVRNFFKPDLHLLDIGKPQSLASAAEFLATLG